MLRDPNNIESQFLRDILGPSAGTVLEVGCGDGRLTAELLGISDTVLALDPDADSIEKARHLTGRGVKLIHGSGEDIPASENSFDTVVFSMSLHHHPDPDRALAEAARVLKEGGRILVLEPEAEAPANRLYRLIHNEDDAYEKAAAAILASDFATMDEGTYETFWRFNDFAEMVEYLFSYYNTEPDQDIIVEMAMLLVDRKDSRSLDVTDITRYWLLKDRSGGEVDQVP